MNQTTVINGKQYYLVPVEQEKETPIQVLSDFIGKTRIVEQQEVEKDENEVLNEQIRLTDGENLDIQKAQPKLYDYRDKYKNKMLTPADITGFAGPNRSMTAGFKDLAVIEEDKRRSEKNRLFYGAGVEYDLPRTI